MLTGIRRAAIVAVCAYALIGCGGTAATIAPKPVATADAINAAVRNYRACGLIVLTPAADGDCLHALLQHLDKYEYRGDAAALYLRARSVGTEYAQCLEEVVSADGSACDGAPFYRLLGRVIRILTSAQPAA